MMFPPPYTGTRREDPEDFVYDLTDASSVLKSSYNAERYALLNQHLMDNIGDIRMKLADVLHAIYDDWVSVNAIRKNFANTNAPQGKLERNAWELSMLILGKADPRHIVEKDPRDKEEPEPVEPA